MKIPKELVKEYPLLTESLVELIQQDAFESGRVSGIEDCMGEFIGGSKEWVVLRSRLNRANATPNPLKSPSL